MRILITGGQGFLGGALARSLVKDGKHQVTVTARRAAPELESIGIKVLHGDLRDAETAAMVTEDQDLIFHTAAKAGVWGSYSDYHAINVKATSDLLKGAQANGVPYFVYTSTPSVTFSGHSQIELDESTPYSKKPLNAYCKTKILAERDVLAAHNDKETRTLALRPHLIYGPNDPHLTPRLFKAAAAKRLFQIGDGNNRVDVTHIKDAVLAHLCVLDRLETEEIWGNAYFITSGKPILMWHWFQELLAWKGLPPVKHRLKVKTGVVIASALELLYRLLRIRSEPLLTRFTALQLGSTHTYSIEKATGLLGYQPTVDPYDNFDKQFEVQL